MNLFISIFKKEIKPKKFFLILLNLILLVFSISIFSKFIDLEITDNDVIRNYQIEKLKVNSGKLDTIILGDSSSGNGFNSKYFNQLSGLNSLNLSLTGSWGIFGSIGMIKEAQKYNSNIKNVIIIHSLSIYNRDISKEALLTLFPIDETIKFIGMNEWLGYYLNLDEYIWNLKYFVKKFILKKPLNWEIDYKNDYIKQNINKFSNNKIQPKFDDNQKYLKISNDKIEEILYLNNFCKNYFLNCIFLNGPMHEDLIEYINSPEDFILQNLLDKFENVIYVPDLFLYSNFKMGDSSSHIDVSFKNESTHNFYFKIKEYLVE